MGKNKNKKQVSERGMLKALNALEMLAKSGDAMEDADPEGGLSTEGTPLSNKAPKGRGEPTMKSRAAAESESVDKAESMSDDDAASAESGEDDGSEDESSDDASSPDAKMGKSLRARADGDEELHKALDVSPFLEALTDQISGALTDLNKSVISAFDERLAKSEQAQQSFNVRLAKGLVLVGNLVKEIVPLVKSQAEMIKSLSGQPNVVQRKSVLNKSEIVEPHGGDGNEDGTGDGPPPARNAMQEWLLSKAEARELDPIYITMWEQNGGSLSVLPLPIRKAMMSDLAKAH